MSDLLPRVQFDCPKHPTHLTVCDLWDQPAKAADFIYLITTKSDERYDGLQQQQQQPSCMAYIGAVRKACKRHLSVNQITSNKAIQQIIILNSHHLYNEHSHVWHQTAQLITIVSIYLTQHTEHRSWSYITCNLKLHALFFCLIHCIQIITNTQGTTCCLLGVLSRVMCI